MKKKRQHFVPRLLLRAFAADGVHASQVNLIVLSSGKRITGASLREQCYRDYFYGIEPGIEEGFAKSEERFAQILRDRSPERLEALTADELNELKIFVYFQRVRTAATVDSTHHCVNVMLKDAIAMIPQFAEINLDSYDIVLNEPAYMVLSAAVDTFPLILDLDVKFIVNAKNLAFVLSDHPVVSCNQYAEHHPKFQHYSGWTGVALKGLQMFLPISPTLCLALYDPTTYQYGSSRSRLCSASVHDIKSLNALQTINADKCIYLPPSNCPDRHVSELLAARQRHPPLRTPMIEHGALLKGGSTANDLIRLTSTNLHIAGQFNFARVIDRNPFLTHDLACLPIRSPKLLAMQKRFAAEIRERGQVTEKDN